MEIDKKIGHSEGVARHCGNLGLIYKMRGELDKAEEMYLKSLEIDKKLGRLEDMASGYCCLGIVYKKRGDNDKALGYLEKSRICIRK